MSAEINAVKRQITNCENNININKAKIKELEEEYDALIKLKEKINGVGTKLLELEKYRRTKKTQLEGIKNVKFVQAYTANMQTVATGKKRKNAFENIDNEIEKVIKRQREIEEEIDNLEAANATYRRNIRNYNNDIDRIKRKEREEREKK